MNERIADPADFNSGQEWSGKALMILQKAEQLIADHGFAGASVRDIALAAGVNVAMINYYFGSKEKLLEAIFKSRISNSRMMLNELIGDTTRTPLEKIDWLIDRYAEKIMQFAPFQQIMMREQLSRNMDWFRGMVREMKTGNQKLIVKIVEQGQRQRQFRRSIDVPLLMCSLMGTLYQIIADPEMLRNTIMPEGIADDEFQVRLLKKTKAHLRLIAHAVLLP